MSSGPITSWQIEGENVDVVIDFVLWGSKITVYGDCSHEIQKHFLLGRKAMQKSILKIRDITFLTKFRIVKAMVSTVIMYDVRVGP